MRLFFLAVAALALSGCCQSIQPWVSAEATAEVEGLPGKWRSTRDPKDVWRAERLKDGCYLLTGRRKEDRLLLRAAKVGKITVADLWQPPSYSSFDLPCHTLLRIEVEGSNLRTYGPNPDQLIATGRRKKATVTELKEGSFSRYIFAAPDRKDLFPVVKAFVASGGKWGEPDTYTRK